MKERYGIVYQEVMRNRDLSAEAKCIYAYLASFTGKDGLCYPSIDTMVKDLNMSRNRITKHMAQLVEAGIIIKERTKNKNLYGRNVYKLNVGSRCTQNEALEDEALEDEALENEALENRALENEAHNINNTNINNTNTNNTNTSSTNSLPNPSHGGKRAKKKKIIHPETPEEIEAVERQVDEICQRRGNGITGKEFCSYYAAQDWKNKNGTPLTDLEAAIIRWEEWRKKDASGNPGGKPRGKPKNKFNNFPQRDYDYGDLERKMFSS